MVHGTGIFSEFFFLIELLLIFSRINGNVLFILSEIHFIFYLMGMLHFIPEPQVKFPEKIRLQSNFFFIKDENTIWKTQWQVWNQIP